MPLHTVFMPPSSFCPEKVSRNSTIYCEPFRTNIVRRLSRKKQRYSNWPACTGKNAASKPEYSRPSKSSWPLPPGADTNDLLGDIARNAANALLDDAQRGCQSLGKQADQICQPDQPNVDS